MLKHYVTFDKPGAFMPESSTREVKTRVPADLRKIPEYCYAINYYDVEEIIVNGEKLCGKAKNKSPRILFGKKYSLEEIAAAEGKDILYRNVARYETKTGVKCIAGNWQPLQKGEVVLASHAELKSMTEAW